MSSSTNKYGILALLLCSTIWGFAFSAQSAGMKHMGPCAFNAVRSVIGAVALMVSLPLLDIINRRKPSVWGTANSPE
ncbi:MAG: DMT family transporter, partial [Lentisphaeria bacterium]|nr:DMT family transporter [Lentisphaeria bacterium]